MLLMIDNYDSFTYNIVQYFAELGQNVIVKRNDQIDLNDIEELAPQYLVIGPGPCDPSQAGISLKAIRYFAGKMPILGVCLGHQAIGEAFGGRIIRAQTLMHGKTSPIHHLNRGVFTEIPNPVIATRYHSLVIDRKTLPTCLKVHAWTADGEIMGIQHQDMALEGVQFHPEAFLTEYGHQMLNNFLLHYR